MFKWFKNYAIAILFAVCALLLWRLITSVWDANSIGTLSDWISSISTFLTLVVAYLAYKAAPQWIEKKKREDAYDLAREVILDDYHDIYISCRNIRAKISGLQYQVTVMNQHVLLATTLQDCDAALASIEETRVQYIQLNHKLNKLRKLSIILDSRVLEALEAMIAHTEMLTRVSFVCWKNARRQFRPNKSPVTNEQATQRIVNMADLTRKHFDELEIQYGIVRDFSDNISDYYTEVRSSQ